jgi:hypothetical protein
MATDGFDEVLQHNVKGTLQRGTIEGQDEPVNQAFRASSNFVVTISHGCTPHHSARMAAAGGRISFELPLK